MDIKWKEKNGVIFRFLKILEEKCPVGRFLLAKLTLSKNSVKNSALRGANEALIDLEQK